MTGWFGPSHRPHLGYVENSPSCQGAAASPRRIMFAAVFTGNPPQALHFTAEEPDRSDLGYPFPGFPIYADCVSFGLEDMPRHSSRPQRRGNPRGFDQDEYPVAPQDLAGWAGYGTIDPSVLSIPAVPAAQEQLPYHATPPYSSNSLYCFDISQPFPPTTEAAQTYALDPQGLCYYAGASFEDGFDAGNGQDQPSYPDNCGFDAISIDNGRANELEESSTPLEL